MMLGPRPTLSTSDVKPSSHCPGPPAIRRSVGGRWSKSGRSSLHALGRPPGGLLAAVNRVAVDVDRVVADVRDVLAVGRPCRLRSLVDDPPAGDDLAVSHDREPPVRCVRRVATRPCGAHASALPAERDDRVVAVERDALAVRRPRRVLAGREPPLVVAVDPDRVDRPAAREREPAAVRRPRRLVGAADDARGMRPVHIRRPEVALRDEGDPRAVRAPGGGVADRKHAVRADVNAGEREHERGDAAHSSCGRLGERQHRSHARVLALECRAPFVERPRAEELGELRDVGRRTRGRARSGRPSNVAEVAPEARLERGDGQVAAVAASRRSGSRRRRR